MPELSDSEVHALLQQLLDVDEPRRDEWLRRRLPDDSQLRQRLLNALQDSSKRDSADGAEPDVKWRPVVHEPKPDRLGRYEVIRVLGEGGMGRVFLAHDPTVRRNVAIKLLRRSFDNPEMLTRFRREARAAGGLRHRNLVTIFDVQEETGRPFIVMEYVDGHTLSGIILRNRSVEPGDPSRWTLSKKLDVIEQLCAGLQYAHGAGVVHRDIKPPNLIVEADGTLRILDFGIAKPSVPEGSDPQTVVTTERMVMGTSGYISPEHLSGQPTDSRSDQFAAAVVAFELLAGYGPFGSVHDDVTGRVLRGEVAPMVADGAELPEPVRDAVMRGLAVRPQDRHADMATMQRALARARASVESQASVAVVQAAAAPSPRWWLRLVAGVVALAAVSWFWTRQPVGPTPGSKIESREARTPPELQPPMVADSSVQRARPAGGSSQAGTRENAGPEVLLPPVVGLTPAGSLVPVPADAPTAVSASSANSDDSDPGPSSRSATQVPSAPVSTGPVVYPAHSSGTEVRQTLNLLEAAIADKSTVAMKRVFPALTQSELALWERRFLDNASYTLTITDAQVSSLAGDRVQVNASVIHAAVSTQGLPRRRTGAVVLMLDRDGGDWLITSIRGPGW